MKLYNLFEEVIFEEVEKNLRLISEGVSADVVKAAIDGKYNVNILYRDYEDQPPSKRYIQVYNLSKTKGGNDAIRAYQIFGASKKEIKTDSGKYLDLTESRGGSLQRLNGPNQFLTLTLIYLSITQTVTEACQALLIR